MGRVVKMAEEKESVESSEELQDLAHLENMVDDSGSTSDGVEEGGQDEMSTDVLLLAIAPLFDVLAPNWKVSDDEKKALAQAYTPVIDKYFGGVDFGVELQAVLVTVMIIAPRLSTPRVINEKKEVVENAGN